MQNLDRLFLARGLAGRLKVLSALSNLSHPGEYPSDPIACPTPGKSPPAIDAAQLAGPGGAGVEQGWVQVAGCHNPVFSKPSSISRTTGEAALPVHLGFPEVWVGLQYVWKGV